MRLGAELQYLARTCAQVRPALFQYPAQLRVRWLRKLDRVAAHWILRFEPATAGVRKRVGVGYIGLDVQHRRAVDHVHAPAHEVAVLRLATGALPTKPRGLGRCGERVASTPLRPVVLRGGSTFGRHPDCGGTRRSPRCVPSRPDPRWRVRGCVPGNSSITASTASATTAWRGAASFSVKPVRTIPMGFSASVFCSTGGMSSFIQAQMISCHCHDHAPLTSRLTVCSGKTAI